MSTHQLIFNIFLLVVVSIFLQAKATVNEKAELSIKSKVIVRQSKPVTLTQLIDNIDVIKKINYDTNKIVLGDSPKIGESRIYSNAALSLALRPHKDLLKRVNFKIPSRILVIHPKSILTEVEVINQLQKEWEKECQPCQIRIRSVQLPVVNSVIEKWELQIPGQIPKGSFSVPIKTYDKFGPRSYWVSGQIELYKEVPVAKKMIPLHSLISEDDLVFRMRNVSYLLNKGIPIKKDLVGLRAKRTITADQIVWSNDVARPKAMKRGDVVNVIIGGKNWSVSLKGLAQEDGYLGEVITIKNLKTDKLFSARVTGSGEAEVQ